MNRPVVNRISSCYRMGEYLVGFLQRLPRQTFLAELEVVLDHNEPSEEGVELIKKFQETFGSYQVPNHGEAGPYLRIYER